MGIEAKVIRGYIRKGSFVLVIGFCSFILHRFLPSLFSLLVSSSPVIFCTALLLGFLLSFEQPNIPKVKEENRIPVTSVRTRCVADDLVFENAARVDEKAIKEAGFKKENEEVLTGKRAVIKDKEKEINGEKKVIKVEKREFHGDIEGHFTDNQKKIKGTQIDSHNQSSDSGSDADSSSSNASVTVVMPTLDELDPLIINSEAPYPTTLTPPDESDAQESDNGSADLAGDIENADEEEVQEKAVVTWTADDEKNLKDLGTSELERNQRLESLIAKRIARKKWMVEAQKNLIDLDGNDGIQISIPARRNPFDPHYDLDEIMGLPVPGSAPSVLLPRLNPFDPPYDRADERGNLMGENSSQQEYITLQQREPFFRRYESFTSGASFLGEMKQQKNDFKWRPHFVAEGMGYNTTLGRQLSEMSDSKVRSIPETDTVTDSVSSIADHVDDDSELLEQDSHQDGELNSLTNCTFQRVERDSESSEEVDSVETDSNPSDAIEETPQNDDAVKGVKVKTGNEREGVNNDQVEEPVYDLSPKYLPNMTAISETLFDAPPITVERCILHGDRESMSYNGNERTEMPSIDEGLWVAPAKLSEVDQNESRVVKEVTEQVHVAVIKDASHDLSSSSPVAKSVEDVLMDEKLNHQLKVAQFPQKFFRRDPCC